MQLTNKIHLLKHLFKVNFGPQKSLDRFVYSLVIIDKSITLIDSGTKESAQRICEYIEQQNRSPKEISRLILSHSHPDHIGGAAQLKRDFGCCVTAHGDARAWIEDIELQIRERPVPAFEDLMEQSVSIDDTIDDRQQISVGDELTLEIIHAPGHAAGQVCVLFREDRILFTADAVPLSGDIPNYDNFPQTMETINRIESSNAYDILLTSWHAPLYDRREIQQFIDNGKRYLHQLDNTVQEIYTSPDEQPLANCSRVIRKLGLPEIFINPICDRAFRSHICSFPTSGC